MTYPNIISPVPGQPVSKSQYGDPVKAAIDDLDARVAALVAGRQEKIKAANETRVSTTTLALDNELKDIPLGIGTWEISVLLAAVGGAGAIAVKTQWAFTGTWNNPLRFIEGPSATNTGDALSGPVSMKRSAAQTNADSVYGLNSSGNYMNWREFTKQIVVTVPGSMAINWAPNVSSATSGGLRQGSSVTCIRMF
jgi:hypothetical protein